MESQSPRLGYRGRYPASGRLHDSMNNQPVLFPCPKCGTGRGRGGAACPGCGYEPEPTSSTHCTNLPASKSSSTSSSGKYLWIFVLCVLPIVAGFAIEFWAYTEEQRTAGRAKPFPVFLAIGLIAATILNAFAGLASISLASGSSDPPFRNLAWILLAIAVILVVVQWGFVFTLFLG